jgi:hypothetical protein
LAEATARRPLGLYALVALGCLFWLYPFCVAAGAALRFGVRADTVLMAGLPLGMIGLTVLTGWLVDRNRHRGIGVIVVPASMLAAIAAYIWLIVGLSAA